MYTAFIQKLKEEINKGLPGWEAQKRMAPLGRTQDRYSPMNESKFRESGVLIWLYPNRDRVYMRLILRSEGGVHSGQVAFPGGQKEQNDNGFWNTALREAKEEIGLSPEEVTPVGGLTPLYIPPSHFWVHPYIGSSDKVQPASINEAEVQKYFDIDILYLLQPGLKEDKLVATGTGEQITVPAYVLEGHIVWGATAMMLSELEELIRRIG